METCWDSSFKAWRSWQWLTHVTQIQGQRSVLKGYERRFFITDSSLIHMFQMHHTNTRVFMTSHHLTAMSVSFSILASSAGWSVNAKAKPACLFSVAQWHTCGSSSCQPKCFRARIPHSQHSFPSNILPYISTLLHLSPPFALFRPLLNSSSSRKMLYLHDKSSCGSFQECWHKEKHPYSLLCWSLSFPLSL